MANARAEPRAATTEWHLTVGRDGSSGTLDGPADEPSSIEVRGMAPASRATPKAARLATAIRQKMDHEADKSPRRSEPPGRCRAAAAALLNGTLDLQDGTRQIFDDARAPLIAGAGGHEPPTDLTDRPTHPQSSQKPNALGYCPPLPSRATVAQGASRSSSLGSQGPRQYQRLDEDHEHMHRTECSASRH